MRGFTDLAHSQRRGHLGPPAILLQHPAQIAARVSPGRPLAAPPSKPLDRAPVHAPHPARPAPAAHGEKLPPETETPA